MDGGIIVSILNKITGPEYGMNSDAKKNDVLINIIGGAKYLTSDEIGNIMECYDFDKSKLQAINIIASGKKLNPPFSSYLPQVISKLNPDLKMYAINFLKWHINAITEKDLVRILGEISSDDDKLEIISILSPVLQVSILDNAFMLRLIIGKISVESNKIVALNLLVKNLLVKPGNKLLMYDIAFVMNEFSNDLFADCYKIYCIELLCPISDISFNGIISIMERLFTDENKVDAIKIFIRNGLRINCYHLLNIISTTTSDSTKETMVFLLLPAMAPIKNLDDFCKKLATVVEKKDSYLKISKKIKNLSA